MSLLDTFIVHDETVLPQTFQDEKPARWKVIAYIILSVSCDHILFVAGTVMDQLVSIHSIVTDLSSDLIGW